MTPVLLGSVAVFAGLGAAAAVLLTIVGERRQVARSLASVALGGRSLSGPSAQDAGFLQRVAVPALDRMTEVGKRLTPAGSTDKLTRLLDLAGNPAPWTLDRLLAAKTLALFATAAGTLLLFAPGGLLRALVFCAPASAFAFWAPDLLLRNAGQKRQIEIQKTLPDALELLTITVEAGMGFDAALNQVARNTDGPLSGEFYRVLQEMQMKSRSDAFRSLSDRTTVSDLRSFVSAMVQADKLGVPIGRVLREQSREMRLKRRQRAEEQAMKVPVKLLIPMVTCILPVLFVVALAPSLMELKQIL